jgi:soluble lytic murein transglycosylase-like protein
VFDRWRYPAAFAVAVGIGFPTLATAASSETSSQAAGKSNRGAAAKRVSPRALTGPARRFQDSIEIGVHQIRVEKKRRHKSRFAHLPGGVSQSTLDAIGECESGGDPHAVSSGGTYRGKYQFDYGTWASVGGHGDPAAASEREQDYRAALLYERSGSSPWPVCA